MAAMIAWLLVAALLGGLATLAFAAVIHRVWLAPRLEARLAAMQDEFERRVKTGVLAAGQELLPALREQVALGFQDALRGSKAAGLAEGTAKVVTGSADLLVDGLGNLFGLKKK